MQPPANHIAMMQIDCEVINTSLVHISEEAIPTHLNARMKSDTGFGGSEAPKPNANSTLERNESTNSFGPKNLFRNIEKSNNLTRRYFVELIRSNVFIFKASSDGQCSKIVNSLTLIVLYTCVKSQPTQLRFLQRIGLNEPLSLRVN